MSDQLVVARTGEPASPRPVGRERGRWSRSLLAWVRSPRVYGPVLLLLVYLEAKGWKSSSCVQSRLASSTSIAMSVETPITPMVA